jgi:predicted membrane-bound mannosyltransferase
MCYWFAASLVAWGALSVIGIYWHPLHALSAATILFGMGIGCVANWLRNRTFHCGITAPLFLLAAAMFLLSDASVVHVNSLFVWPFVLVGVCIAFLLEWRYARVVRRSS